MIPVFSNKIICQTYAIAAILDPCIKRSWMSDSNELHSFLQKIEYAALHLPNNHPDSHKKDIRASPSSDKNVHTSITIDDLEALTSCEQPDFHAVLESQRIKTFLLQYISTPCV